MPEPDFTGYTTGEDLCKGSTMFRRCEYEYFFRGSKEKLQLFEVEAEFLTKINLKSYLQI